MQTPYKLKSWIPKLKSWIPIEKLDWSNISLNPNAIHLLEKYSYNIQWSCLSNNPNAVQNHFIVRIISLLES